MGLFRALESYRPGDSNTGVGLYVERNEIALNFELILMREANQLFVFMTPGAIPTHVQCRADKISELVRVELPLARVWHRDRQGGD